MKRFSFFLILVLIFISIILGISPDTQNVSSAPLIGFRTENPGAFLQWPLPDSVNVSSISRLPDSPWTHHFLGITDCPPYPALLDAGYWPYSYAGNYPGNRQYILPGIPDERVKWQNNGKSIPGFGNAFACYGANSSLGLLDHEGTDISAPNGTHVLAAASGYIHAINGSRYTIRHDNVNNSGQTWYTTYVHVTDMRYSVGTYVAQGTWIANVGSGHLHFETLYNGIYSANVRNLYGIDSAPWNGCLWLDQSLCPTAQNPPTDFNQDGYPDIYVIKRTGTGTHSTEVHILNGADSFQSWLLQTGTVRPETGTNNAWVFAVDDYNRDGHPDVYMIKRTNTGTNSTEVHILNGADNFQSYLLQTGTAYAETGTDNDYAYGVADFNGDGYPDVYVIARANTGTNSTELHVLNGANNFQSFLLQTGTVHPEMGANNAWAFAIDDYNRDGHPDVYMIKRTNTGTNSTEIHILNGADNFQSYLLQTGTILHKTGTDGRWAFGSGDYNKDGYPDIYVIKRDITPTDLTEVHILNGADNFQSYLVHIGTIRPETGTSCAWMFAFSSSQCFPESSEPPNNYYVYIPMIKR